MTTTYNQLRQLLTDRLPHLTTTGMQYCEYVKTSNEFKDTQVFHKDGRSIFVKNVQAVIFGSTLDNGEGIKLFGENGEEWYWYQNGQENYLTQYRRVRKPDLQDILLAIGSHKYAMDFRGNFDIALYVDSGLAKNRYDLTKQLADQSDETLLALMELVK